MNENNFKINFINELNELIATGKYSKVKITIPKKFCGVEFAISKDSELVSIETIEHSGFNLDK